MNTERSAKRLRLDDTDPEEIRAKRSAFLSSLSRPVSPPANSGKPSESEQEWAGSKGNSLSTRSEEIKTISIPKPAENDSYPQNYNLLSGENQARKVLRSPFQLARARGPPASDNVDTISLHDVLGDPLIKQAWIFNFCFDVNWTMKHFDADVRELVDVKIVHGSWRKEDRNRMQIKEHLQGWKNIQEIQAYMPDAFGTHHSKMIVLFKHDDTAQVTIHTANMLEKDWDHMTQAVWRSPALPILQDTDSEGQDPRPLGSGSRFKHDLLRYMKAYGSKLKLLAEQLANYDFSEVRAALIASVPSHTKASDLPDQAWGHLALRNALSTIHKTRSPSKPPTTTSHLVCQVSSIATLPASWLDETLFKAATPSASPTSTLKAAAPTTSIIYPTPSDLRTAITGYATGGSIHTKLATTAQQKQVALLRPHLHRWGVQSPNPSTRAGRHLLPPHIKTYINFSTQPTPADSTPDIEWALLTSANLSTQAWGTAPKLPKGVRDPAQAAVHVQSFEIGVLVWPELFLDGDGDGDRRGRARMVPCFGRDTPDVSSLGSPEERKEEGDVDVVVGLRMPYDLPLTPYAEGEMPWSPNATYMERDRLGLTWG